MSNSVHLDSGEFTWLIPDDQISRDFRAICEAYRRVTDSYAKLLESSAILADNGVYCPFTVNFNGTPIDSQQHLNRLIKKRCWLYILEKLQVKKVMSYRRWEEFMDLFYSDSYNADIDSFPDITPENINEIVAGYAASVVDFFKESVREEWLYWTPKRDTYVTNQDRWKVSPKVIIQNAGRRLHQLFMLHDTTDRHLRNLGLIFQVMDGIPIQHADPDITSEIDWRSRDTHDTKYFKIRTFSNGNLHLTMKRLDLLEQFNFLGAGEDCGLPNPSGKEYAPVVDPFDEIPETKVDDLASKSLDFYPTPRGIVHMMYDHAAVACSGRRSLVLLEPSAGVGDLLCFNRMQDLEIARVVAMELDKERADLTDRKLRLDYSSDSYCECRDFLKAEPLPFADVILMNPPFSSYRYVYHVVHAAKFLRQDGILVAVIPPTWFNATTGILKKFSDWVHTYQDWTWQVNPDKAFAASGTGVSTGILTIIRSGSKKELAQSEDGTSANITHQ